MIDQLSKFNKTCVALAVSQCVLVSVQAADLVVNSVTDNGIDCTLREATESISAGMDLSNGCGGVNFGIADTIGFDSSLTAISSASIVLQNGELEISKDVVITGLGRDNLFIDGNDDSRVFNISGGAKVEISELTIQNGSAGANGNYGGGIWAHASNTSITLSNCALTSNYARSGGGVAVDGNATFGSIDNCIISGNNTTSRGGGITSTATAENTSLVITNSQISGNTASGSSRGGGLFAFGSQVTISGSDLFDNFAPGGGAIRAQRATSMSVTNSNIYNNVANVGSAIQLDNSTVEIDSSTVFDNSQASALHLGGNYGASILTVTNSQISGNGRAMQLATTDSTLTLDSSTVFDHLTNTWGAAAYVRNGTFNAINSTFSSNRTVNASLGGGGAIAAINASNLNIFNCTFSENTTAKDGGHISVTNDANLNINNTLLSGGAATGLGAEIFVSTTGVVTSNNNLWGNSDNAKTTADALYGLTANSNDILVTSDSQQPTALADIISPLADNGGASQTHLPADKSPAVDAGNDSNCGQGMLIDVDQRGEPRDDGSCDIGAIEVDQPPQDSFFVVPLSNEKNVIFSL